MGQENWIAAHVNSYRYFGGVTRILKQDNLKTGLTKNTRDELVINRSYREMAEYYGTAIIPARPRAPKDEAAMEGTVGVVSTFILAALRKQQFLSIRELNEAVWDRLYGFNH
jgi:transposase